MRGVDRGLSTYSLSSGRVITRVIAHLAKAFPIYSLLVFVLLLFWCEISTASMRCTVFCLNDVTVTNHQRINNTGAKFPTIIIGFCHFKPGFIITMHFLMRAEVCKINTTRGV